MDISTPIIFFGIFIIACVSLFLVFKFGIKEKSYEEALAEQRQQTNALLGIKSKPKEKKSKKSSKKPKEKQISTENEPVEETIESSNSKPHVEFKDEPEELSPLKESPAKKPIKKEKVRPILIHKEINEPMVTPNKEVVIVNHFESIHPKDAVELLRSNSRDDLAKPEPVKEKVGKEKKEVEHVKTKRPKHAPAVENTPVEKKEEKKVEMAPAPVPTNGLTVNTGKEKKKKKSEFNTLQQLTAERDGLFTLVRKAELSRNEIQTLIELLLNKQHEAPTVVGDWSEGKSDPIQKLKKQLADKEKLLADEQEALAGMQAKVREIRNEQQTEKSQLNQKVRALEELLNTRTIETDAANNRLQANEQKIQQLQGQLNEELGKFQMLIEENKALQHQKQQLELRLAQGQEAENHVMQLRNELHNSQLEVHRLNNENVSLKDILLERSEKCNNFQIETDQLKMINKQLEETRQGLEREIGIVVRKDDELKAEISHLNTSLHKQIEENRKNEYTLEQIGNENRQLKAEKIETAKIIAQLNDDILQLRDDLQKIQDEKQKLETTQINGSAEENEAHRQELVNLKQELLNLDKSLNNAQTQLQQTSAQLDESNSRNQTLQKEIEEQKAKNNDLRQKNWKVMEALNIAESRSKSSSSPKQSPVSLDVLSNDIRLKEQDSQKQFIQRLFPEIEDLKTASSNDDWQQEFGKLIENYIGSLKKTQTVNDDSILKLQVINYKNIIDETESQLIHLQKHIAEAERDWRDLLAQKDAEIENLKEHAVIQLKTKLQEQEKKLIQEQSRTESLSRECQQLKSKSHNADAASTIEKLTEEVNRLSELLRLEQAKKNGDVNGSSKEQNFKATNGLSLIEHSLSSSSTSLTSSEAIHTKKIKNKKKKKKGNGN